MAAAGDYVAGVVCEAGRRVAPMSTALVLIVCAAVWAATALIGVWVYRITLHREVGPKVIKSSSKTDYI